MFEFKVDINKDAPVIGVKTTDNRGFTPEELAEQCVDKIISVSDTAESGIRDQARAFSRHIETLVACDRLFAVTAQLCIMHSRMRETPNWLNL